MNQTRSQAMVKAALKASSFGLPNSYRDVTNLLDIDEEAVYKGPVDSYAKYRPGMWSAFVEPLFLALRLMKQCSDSGSMHSPEVFMPLFAKQYSEWSKKGFCEWGEDTTPFQQDENIHLLCSNEQFADNPMKVVSDNQHAEVDFYTPVISIAFALESVVPEFSMMDQDGMRQLCFISDKNTPTHASAVYLSVLLRHLLNGATDFKICIKSAAESARSILKDEDQHRTAFFNSVMQKDLQNMYPTSGYHLEYVRIATYAYRCCLKNSSSPKVVFAQVTRDVVQLSGQAGFNCAIAGAVVGAFFGPECLPEWEIARSEWVDRELERFFGNPTAPRDFASEKGARPAAKLAEDPNNIKEFELESSASKLVEESSGYVEDDGLLTAPECQLHDAKETPPATSVGFTDIHFKETADSDQNLLNEDANSAFDELLNSI